jgi:hypothetical protein
VKNSLLTKLILFCSHPAGFLQVLLRTYFAAESVFARLYSLTVLWVAYNSVP